MRGAQPALVPGCQSKVLARNRMRQTLPRGRDRFPLGICRAPRRAVTRVSHVGWRAGLCTWLRSMQARGGRGAFRATLSSVHCRAACSDTSGPTQRQHESRSYNLSVHRLAHIGQRRNDQAAVGKFAVHNADFQRHPGDRHAWVSRLRRHLAHSREREMLSQRKIIQRRAHAAIAKRCLDFGHF